MIGFGLIPYYPSDIDWSKYLVHLLFLQDYLGAHILVPLWSLATEEKFYLLAPFLLLLVNRLSPIKSIVLLIFFIILMVLLKSILMNEADHAINYITFFEQYRAPFHFAVGSILMGVIVAILAQFEAPKHLPIWAFIAAVLIVVVLFLANLYNPNNWNWMNVLHTVVVFLFAVLVWVAVKHTGAWYMRFLTGRVFRIIAVLSYALYLAHYTILPWVYRLHKHYIQSEEAWIHAGSFLLLYLFVAVIFSLLLHYLVEKPFLTIKNRL
jgi:peptidoglycan/LPS O-acetylase OafA/YrhL